MEVIVGEREAAVHRRGEAPARHAHEGAPRLQVQAAQEAEDPAQGRLPLHHALPVRAHRRSASRSVQIKIPEITRAVTFTRSLTDCLCETVFTCLDHTYSPANIRPPLPNRRTQAVRFLFFYLCRWNFIM